MEKRPSIPLFVKLAFTAYAAVHITISWHVYGPVNFLYFCDIAMFTTLAALWLESRFLTSVSAISVLLPMMLWIIDLLGRIFVHRWVFGFAGYMFDHHIPLSARLVSTFHLWMPLLLIWMLMRLGYDRRALWAQWAACIVVLIICRWISDPPPSVDRKHAVNINWVYGFNDEHPQTIMPGWMYLGIMLVFYPVVIYLPTHLALVYLFAKPKAPHSEPLPAKPEVLPQL